MIPIILCGGVGSRLWPVSREANPKQYLRLIGKDTMLQDTLRRSVLVGDRAPIIICNEEHRFTTAEQVRQSDLDIETIILEPEGRNTAPALALAAFLVVKSDPNAILVVMPADHVILDDTLFTDIVFSAAESAEKNMLMTLGIKPESPETGYGYIRRGLGIGKNIYKVDEFVEKPDRELAETYCADGNFFWNSGIFLVKASVYLQELKSCCPLIYTACESAMKTARTDMDFLRPDDEAFRQCPSLSIDYAVMEKTKRAGVAIFERGWSDIGSWSALWSVSHQDDHGNAVRGDVLVDRCRNSYIRSESRLVAASGLKDIVLVETSDAVLAASMEDAQGIRQLVKALKLNNRSEVKNSKEIFRPWGSYESLVISDRFQVKRIIVKPGHALSLQKHFHRAEHWVVVRGLAEVTCASETFDLRVDESIYIPVNTKHRLRNRQNKLLEVIEVQTGEYLGEDDIERYEDEYGRSE